MQSYIHRLAVLALLVGALPATIQAHPVSAQEGSGRIVREFLLALDAGDIDAAMALMTPFPELETDDGRYLSGVEDVRAFLAALPRPIVVVSTLPWGGRRHEAQILAGDQPFLLYFQGAGGLISYIFIAPDQPPAVTASAPNSTRHEPEPRPEPEPAAEGS